MSASRARSLGALALAILLLSGCGLFSQTRSIGIAAQDVASIQYYEYPWGTDAEVVDRLTIENDRSNREIVEEWVDTLIDLPTRPVSADILDEVDGEQAQGMRFIMKDRSTVEATRIFLFFSDALIVWPGGEVTRSDWASRDKLDDYGEFGTIEQVDADERPNAELLKR